MSHKTVLLIDSDYNLAKIRCLILNHHGLSATCVIELDEGILLSRHQKFDLILINFSFGVTTCIELCKDLKRGNPSQTVAFISDLSSTPVSCADEIIESKQGARYFLARVQFLIHSHEAI